MSSFEKSPSKIISRSVLVALFAFAAIALHSQVSFGAISEERGLPTYLENATIIEEDGSALPRHEFAETDGSSGNILYADKLSSSKMAAKFNSHHLQSLINSASESGGGTVYLPKGTYYFAAIGHHQNGDYAILARDNVTLSGAGMHETMLKPYGEWENTGNNIHGIDMFYYDGIQDETPLVNADFKDFSINGDEAKGNAESYNASGKGFFFKYFRDCDWTNVLVANTDGSGFGVDFPIRSNITSCIATTCGKNATSSDIGASGFGIGTGYSYAESIKIEDCIAFNNTKFGFFFEHQTRFDTEITASASFGYEVIGCRSSGNLYNFGGNRAHDVAYRHCTSEVSPNIDQERYVLAPFHFENHSCRIDIDNCMVEQSLVDLTKEYEQDVFSWGMSEGIFLPSRSNGRACADPRKPISTQDAITYIWRACNYPGDMVYGWNPSNGPTLRDAAEKDEHVQSAIQWAQSVTSIPSYLFDYSHEITNGEFVELANRLMTGTPKTTCLLGRDEVCTNTDALAILRSRIEG